MYWYHHNQTINSLTAPSPSTQRCEGFTLQLPPPPVSTLSHLNKVVPPFSPSPSSRAALCTKGILHSAGVWKTPGPGLFCKVVYIVLLRSIVSQTQLENIKPHRWDIFENVIVIPAALRFAYGIWARVWMNSCWWMISPLPPYCNSNHLQFSFTLKFKRLRLHR